MPPGGLHQAVARLTPLAMAMVKVQIATTYGNGPDRSYLCGRSNVGRHAMVEAARSQAHGGCLIGTPGYPLAQLWGAQQWVPMAVADATTQHPRVPTETQSL